MPTKTPSKVSSIVTVILLLLVGAASMFFLLIALNGVSEREGTPALLTSLICNGVSIIISAVLAWKMSAWLIGKFNWSNALAVIVSVLVGLIFGGGLSLVTIFIGVAVADSIWRAR